MTHNGGGDDDSSGISIQGRHAWFELALLGNNDVTPQPLNRCQAETSVLLFLLLHIGDFFFFLTNNLSLYPLADVTNCNRALFSSVPPPPPPQSPPPRDQSDKFALFVCLTNPAKFDKNLRLAFLLSAAPLPSLFICLLQSLSNLSTPFNLSASLDICSSLHFLHFCLLPTFRPAISFPPLRVVVLSSRSGAASPEYSWGGGAGRVGAKRLFPLHFTQGLEMRRARPQTDGAPLRGERVVLLARPKRETCSKYVVVVFLCFFFFCLCFEKKKM